MGRLIRAACHGRQSGNVGGIWMAGRKYKAGRIFNKFLKLIIGAYMKLLFSYRIEAAGLKEIKPPFVVFANHTSFWDPFLLSMCFKDPVYFITSDAYFRNPLLKWLLGLVGAIPKTKLVSDPGSIRGILEVVKNGGIIGIFPEGKRNWDGRTLPPLPPTAKLIKALKIPVVTILFKGACLSMPRWSKTTRKGSLVMELVNILKPDEIATLSLDELYGRISGNLSYDEYSLQRSVMHAYAGKKLAERLELFLFTCPECSHTGTLSSRDGSFGCSECGYGVIYNRYGFFESSGQSLQFDNPADWNQWQLKRLEADIAESIEAAPGNVLMEEPVVILRTGSKTGALKGISDKGVLSLFPGRLEYISEEKKVLDFPLKKISGVNIQYNNQLEFIFENTLYRFSKKDGRMPAYKFVMGVGTARQLLKEAAEQQ